MIQSCFYFSMSDGNEDSGAENIPTIDLTNSTPKNRPKRKLVQQSANDEKMNESNCHKINLEVRPLNFLSSFQMF